MSSSERKTPATSSFTTKTMARATCCPDPRIPIERCFVGEYSFHFCWRPATGSLPTTAEASAGQSTNHGLRLRHVGGGPAQTSHLSSACKISSWSASRWAGVKVARYFGNYGSNGVSKAVIISGVPPYLLKTADDPDGVDASVFDGIQKAVAADRYAFFTGFFQNFYNTDVCVFLGKRVSEQAVQANWNIAAGASATASLACVPTWYEDFREDLARVDVPTLVIHGDADRILPIAATGHRTAKLTRGARLLVVKDGPHCIPWTHAEEVNAELLSFLGGKTCNLQKEVA